jgi:transcriptional regulator GlxA family with amidase domain
MYVDSLSMAIVARLWSLARRKVADGRSEVRALPRWRLRRAIDYVESRLAEPISLAEIASVTGLTRMHFAAEFRAATGLRPHEYLLRRRIERSQEMLMTTDMTLVDIALAVGFQTQSHYSNVFRRFVGQSPVVWLRSRCGEKPRARRALAPAFTSKVSSAANVMVGPSAERRRHESV